MTSEVVRRNPSTSHSFVCLGERAIRESPLRENFGVVVGNGFIRSNNPNDKFLNRIVGTDVLGCPRANTQVRPYVR